MKVTLVLAFFSFFLLVSCGLGRLPACVNASDSERTVGQCNKKTKAECFDVAMQIEKECYPSRHGEQIIASARKDGESFWSEVGSYYGASSDSDSFEGLEAAIDPCRDDSIKEITIQDEHGTRRIICNEQE